MGVSVCMQKCAKESEGMYVYVWSSTALQW